MSIVIALVGMCGSGKSSAARFFNAVYGWPIVYLGQVTMDEVKRRGLQVSEKNERLVREDLRNIHGKGAYAILTLPKINEVQANSPDTTVVLDGLYSWSEYEQFRDNLPGLILVAIVSPKRVRYERLSSRLLRPLSKSEAATRDEAEIVFSEKGGPIAIADYFINNDDSFVSFHSRLDHFVDMMERAKNQ